MADRVGVISKGQLILVEQKTELMRKLGKKRLTLQLAQPIAAVPEGMEDYGLELASDGAELVYTYDTQKERTGITGLLSRLSEKGVSFTDLSTKQSSLEEIFVELVRAR